LNPFRAQELAEPKGIGIEIDVLNRQDRDLLMTIWEWFRDIGSADAAFVDSAS